ncbi:HAD-IIIA family hydrolase [Polynucleobacter paneuropaeus]|nr:HAD-IIIA family hydrolase [Polynucleobacter paneuropaeus]
MTSAIINQAVVLCGGLGTRLKPLTDHAPKPMVLVNGKPFLYYLLSQLASEGVINFLLLTGYLSEQIKDFFGDGSEFGWNISYSSGPKEWDTGRRLWEARSKIDEYFLLMYSDNFSEFNIEKLLACEIKVKSILTLTLASKKRGNIKLGSDEFLEDYDNSRPEEGYDFVEIGYMLVNKEALFKEFPSTPGYPDFNLSILLKRLVGRGIVRGIVSNTGYHSISDLDRLKLTEDYLRPKKILLIDRDGTINRKALPGQYIANWSEFEWIPSSYLAMKKLADYGFKFIVITNQAGVDRGMVRLQDLEEIHQNMTQKFLNDGIEILHIYTCTDHWEKNSPRRKPMPGMFYEASKQFNFRLKHVLYIGDDERDCEAAQNSGCGMIYLNDEPPLNVAINRNLPFIQSNNLYNVVDEINQIYSNWGCK